MGHSRADKAQSRERIIAAAARQIREGGLESVSIADLMKQANLTHGGFYGHFASKDDLVAEAVARALEHAVEQQSDYADLSDLVAGYLSERHLADRTGGCAIAALGADLARQGDGARRNLTAHVRAQIERFVRLLKNGPKARRRRRAIATLAGMVGALTLARAVDDPALSREILAAARDTMEKTLSTDD